VAYQIGDLLIVGNHTATGAAAFTVADGTPTDPTAVVLTVQRPDETQLVYAWPSAGADGTLTRQSAGRLYYLVEMDQDGVWGWRLEGTGAVTAAAQGSFYVEPLNVLVSD
jgi:hypothetical protein